MSAVLSFAAVQQADGGLTWSKFVDNLPTEPAAIFVLLLLGGCVAWIVWVGRRGGHGGPPASRSTDAPG